jgi:hypothetical protein
MKHAATEPVSAPASTSRSNWACTLVASGAHATSKEPLFGEINTLGNTRNCRVEMLRKLLLGVTVGHMGGAQ